MVAILTGGIPTGQLSSTGSVGLKVIGEGDLAKDGAGAEVAGMTEDLIGAGLTGGTFIDDTTVGGGGVAVGTVMTTTEAAAVAGSEKQSGRTNQIWYMNWLD